LPNVFFFFFFFFFLTSVMNFPSLWNFEKEHVLGSFLRKKLEAYVQETIMDINRPTSMKLKKLFSIKSNTKNNNAHTHTHTQKHHISNEITKRMLWIRGTNIDNYCIRSDTVQMGTMDYLPRIVIEKLMSASLTRNNVILTNIYLFHRKHHNFNIFTI